MDSYSSRATVVDVSAYQAINRSKNFGLDKTHLAKEDRS